MENKERRILALSALIWLVTNLHHPVTPTFFTELNLPDHVFGTSYAIMVLGMLFTSPIWGSLGDGGYRIKVLRINSLLYGIFQIGFSRANSLFTVILFRALSGSVASGFHVGLISSVVDISDEGSKDKNIATYSAIMSIFGAIGFLVGGLLGYLPVRTAILIQGVIMIIISFLIGIFIEETNAHLRKEKLEKPVFIWDLVKEARKSEGLFTEWIKIFLFITLFVGISHSSYNNAFNYYLKAELGLKPIVNGIWKSVNGIMGLIANLTINIWLINNTNTRKSIVVLLLLSTISGIGVFFSQSMYLFFIFNFMFFLLYVIELPILQSFAVAGAGGAGLMSGLYNVAKSLGEMIGSTAAGKGYEISSNLPFLIGAIAMGIAFMFSLYNMLKNEKAEEA